VALVGKKIRWIIAIVILIFGIITIDLSHWKWSLLGLFIYTIPVFLQFTKSQELQVYSLWGGIFFITQALASQQLLLPNDFVTLPPNLYQVLNVKSGLPGINGKQKITTDSKGFRTTKEIDYNNKKNYRIFAIGGSTTEQIYLDDQHTWTHLLQEDLSKKLHRNVEVINTGVSGTRTKQHLATLKKIIKFHPDLIVFLIGINDWNHHISIIFPEKLNFIKRFKTYRQSLFLRNTMVAKPLLMVQNSFKNKHSVDEYGGNFSKQRGSLSRNNVKSFFPENVSQDYKQNLEAISDTCHENNLICMFINQPTGYSNSASEDFKEGFWMTPPYQPYTLSFDSMVYIASFYNSYLSTFAKEHHHYFCDAAANLSPSYDNFYDDCHFNENGAKNMSYVVEKCIEDLFK
jgi:lysophospholipase L1-like esterase